MKKEYIPLNNSTAENEYLKWLSESENSDNHKYWIRLIEILNQMIGLISVETDYVYLHKRLNSMFECCYLNGMVGITAKDNKIQLWSIAGEIKYDLNGDVEYVDVLPYISMSYNNINYKNLKRYRIQGKDIIIAKANPQGYNLYFLWNRIIKDNLELLDIYLTNARLNVKKFNYIVNNESDSITNKEIETILDPKIPFIKTINPISRIGKDDLSKVAGEQNVLQPLIVNDNNYYFTDVVNHWIFETNLMGLFADEYHKKERNTAGENENSQANTIILHDVLLREWEKVSLEFKEKFNIDVKFYKTMILTADSNSEGEKENEETKSNNK